MTRTIRTAALTLIGIAMLAVATPARPRYSFVDLGVLLGDFNSFATDINNRGQIVGAIERSASPYPFLLEDGVVTELPGLSNASFGVARAINDRGQIVGDIAQQHAVLWEGGGITELASESDPRFTCSANAINNREHVAGACNGSAFVWEDGILTVLPKLPGGAEAVAYGINRRGTIVGYATAADGAVHAVFWQRGEIVALAQLPGSTFSMAFAINNRGQIVGMALDASGVFRGVLWHKGAIIPLETLNVASAINNRGQIAGRAGGQPALWERGSVIQLPVRREGDDGGALGINNHGDIVGSAGSSDTSDVAVRWTRRPQR